MPSIRWDWIFVGAGCLVVGLAGGMVWEQYFGSGWSTMVGAAAGTAMSIGVALYLIHYKQEFELRQYEMLVCDAAQALYDEVHVLDEITNRFFRDGMPTGDTKAQEQAKRVLDEMKIFQRHFSERKTGKFELRRGVLKLDKRVTSARTAMQAALSGASQGLPAREALQELGGGASELRDYIPRFFVEVGRPLRELSKDDIEMRIWAVDHE